MAMIILVAEGDERVVTQCCSPSGSGCI